MLNTQKRLDEDIELAEHNPAWRHWFIEESAVVATAFSSVRLVAVEHHGSSSVPGLISKPIVDILVGLDTFTILPEERSALEALGYEYYGQRLAESERLFLRKRGTRNFNLALVQFGGFEWNKTLLTRDYLRTHPEEAALYAQVKQEAITQGLTRTVGYRDYKEPFILALQERARQWKASQLKEF